MDQATLEYLVKLEEAINGEASKQSLDSLFSTLRNQFVYDNLVIYLTARAEPIPEVSYARAIGRGRSAEADAAWGEEIASQVISSGKPVHTEPQLDPKSDRVRQPFLLGLPFSAPGGRGALVFIRFGGPPFLPEQVLLGRLIASLVSRVYTLQTAGEHAEQLATARHRAQLQDDFIATISHDLRTPIGFIKGYTTSLLRSDTEWNAETQKEFLTIIDEETDHLVLLIDRLLDSARLQSGSLSMNMQPVRMDALLRDAAHRVNARHPDLIVHLDIQPLPPIRADSVRMVEVFDNLFDNAMKYAPGSDIRITALKEKDRIKVLFADEGPGIAPEHLPFLFERFYRVPDSLSNRGAGLGLFICREIIRAHGGGITVETAPKKGTVFCIELPVVQAKGAN